MLKTKRHKDNTLMAVIEATINSVNVEFIQDEIFRELYYYYRNGNWICTMEKNQVIEFQAKHNEDWSVSKIHVNKYNTIKKKP